METGNTADDVASKQPFVERFTTDLTVLNAR